jgi:hypothetical protein
VIGVDFDGYFSFLTGKDLLRKGSSCAASARSDVYDFQWRLSIVFDDKIVDDLHSFNHGIELEFRLSHDRKGRFSGFIDRVGRMKTRNKKCCKQEKNRSNRLFHFLFP